MAAATITPEFQVVIPRWVRESPRLTTGRKIEVITYNDRIEMIPENNISDTRGFLKGIDTSFEREDRL